MKDRVQRRVVCAAVRASDKSGDIVVGVRHFSPDMRNQIERMGEWHKYRGSLDENQGFVDQWGVYMTREEAYQVAMEAGQILHPDACGTSLYNGPRLYSEGLY